VNDLYRCQSRLCRRRPSPNSVICALARTGGWDSTTTTMIIIIIICRRRRRVTYLCKYLRRVYYVRVRAIGFYTGHYDLLARRWWRRCATTRVWQLLNAARTDVVDVWRLIILLLSRHYRYYHRHYIMIYNKLSSSYSQRSDACADERGVNRARKFFWMVYLRDTSHKKRKQITKQQSNRVDSASRNVVNRWGSPKIMSSNLPSSYYYDSILYHNIISKWSRYILYTAGWLIYQVCSHQFFL